jgi:hypothetical protein
MPPAPGQEEPIKRVDKIVTSILAQPDAAPFAEPVDWRGLELYDYPQIIKRMMDLGTIKRRLERGQYGTAHQVAEDVRLVWRNCMTYNSEGSDFWLLAKAYARRWEDRYRKVRQEFDVGEDLEGSNNDDDDAEEEDDDEDGDDNDDDDDEEDDDDEYVSGRKKGGRSSTNTATTSPPASSDHHRKGSSRNSSKGGTGGRSSTPTTTTGSADDGTTNAPSLDVRARFGSNLFLLSGVEMGYVMSTCELECPEVLESWTSVVRQPATDEGGDENKNNNNNNSTSLAAASGGRGQQLYEANVEINVDAIPSDIFAKLNTYVTSKVGHRTLSGGTDAPTSTSTPSGGGDSRSKKKQRKSN